MIDAPHDNGRVPIASLTYPPETISWGFANMSSQSEIVPVEQPVRKLSVSQDWVHQVEQSTLVVSPQPYLDVEVVLISVSGWPCH
jgi:hypothetical protein